MTVKTIEAEYQITSTQFWEIKHIEGWPRDSHGPLPLESAHDYYIKWGLLHVQWEKDDGHVEYGPTAEENGGGGDCYGMDYKWPDVLYYDGQRAE